MEFWNLAKVNVFALLYSSFLKKQTKWKIIRLSLISDFFYFISVFVARLKKILLDITNSHNMHSKLLNENVNKIKIVTL